MKVHLFFSVIHDQTRSLRCTKKLIWESKVFLCIMIENQAALKRAKFLHIFKPITIMPRETDHLKNTPKLGVAAGSRLPNKKIYK